MSQATCSSINLYKQVLAACKVTLVTAAQIFYLYAEPHSLSAATNAIPLIAQQYPGLEHKFLYSFTASKEHHHFLYL